MLRDLRAAGASTYFLKRLHAKLVWSPTGALMGSANLTNAGLTYNDELMLEVNTPGEPHSRLGEAARALLAKPHAVKRTA